MRTMVRESENRSFFKHVPNSVDCCASREARAVRLGSILVQIERYMPVVWADADCQLIVIVAHPQFANFLVHGRDGELIPVSELLGVRNLWEFTQELLAEVSG